VYLAIARAMASMAEAGAALHPTPAFACEDGGTPRQQRKKYAAACAMVAVLSASVMVGFFALGPFVRHEMVDRMPQSHGHSLAKFFHPPVVRRGGQPATNWREHPSAVAAPRLRIDRHTPVEMGLRNRIGNLFKKGKVRIDRAATPWGYLPSSQDYIAKSDTSGRLLAALKMKVFKELGIDPKPWVALESNKEMDRGITPAWLTPESNSSARMEYWIAREKDWRATRKAWLAGSQKREFDHRMGMEMLAALQQDVLLTGQHVPKKRLCVFDFDGTLTEDRWTYPEEKLGSVQRITALRHLLETLHADSHIAVCSLNSQEIIVATLRAAKLLDLFDIVVDRNHMSPLGFNKGRALQELLLPLFPAVGGSGDVLFVDDDSRNIDDLQETAPDCTTFMCERNTGLTIADMDFLLGGHK